MPVAMRLLQRCSGRATGPDGPGPLPATCGHARDSTGQPVAMGRILRTPEIQVTCEPRNRWNLGEDPDLDRWTARLQLTAHLLHTYCTYRTLT